GFDAFLEHAAGAVILGPTQLFHRLRNVKHRQHRDPAQPTATLLGSAADPAIVRFAQSDIDLGSRGESVQEQRRIQYLHVDAQLVHVAHASIDVEKFPGRLHRAGAFVIAPAFELDRAVDQPEEVRSGVARRGGRSRIDQYRFEAPRAVIEIFPGGVTFIYMSIDIDSKHVSSLAELTLPA